MGLQTVAIYSFEVDFAASFKADEAFLSGPAEGGEPVRSYLNIPAIIEVARRHGADAIIRVWLSCPKTRSLAGLRGGSIPLLACP